MRSSASATDDAKMNSHKTNLILCKLKQCVSYARSAVRKSTYQESA